MIIPVRCVTCGKVIADKWRWFQERVGEEGKEGKGVPDEGGDRRRKEAMDELGLVRYCCRRHMISHVDLVHLI